MQKVFLHGFATNPNIWHHQHVDLAPVLDFENIREEGRKVEGSIGRETVLVGWSMGGMVAMEIAARAGENLKALILVSSTPKFVKTADFPEGLSIALLRRLEKRIETEGTAAFHSLVFKNGETIGLEHLPPKRAERELAELSRVDLRGVLCRIRVPTLIIHGSQDEICLPAAAHYLKNNIELAQLAILPEIGHAPMIEAAEQFNTLLENFIASHA